MKNTYTFRAIVSLAFAGFFAIASFAENKVDIGIFQADGNLEVKVRPQTDFDGLFAAVVFTIRWDKNSGASLGDINGANGVQWVPMTKSGSAHEDGVNNYQVFSGLGFQTLQAQGMEWKAGEEYTVLTIPYNGVAEFELVNDAWTNIAENNANYYVSLGGTDETGSIYKGSTGMVESLEGSVLIQPNPNNGIFSFSFTVDTNSDLELEVVNTLGQVMYSQSLTDFAGNFKHEMDLTDESNGVYYLKLKDGDNVSVHKIIFR